MASAHFNLKFSSSLPTAGELEIVFNKFDANGDGKISWSELGGLMRCLGHNTTDEELQLMVADVDKNGDGFIDLQEFIELNIKGIDSAGSLQDLRDAFGIFDVNGDGCISAQELHRVLNGLERVAVLEECYGMIRAVDANCDGYVSFDEFFVMMTSSS